MAHCPGVVGLAASPSPAEPAPENPACPEKDMMDIWVDGDIVESTVRCGAGAACCSVSRGVCAARQQTPGGQRVADWSLVSARCAAPRRAAPPATPVPGRASLWTTARRRTLRSRGTHA